MRMARLLLGAGIAIGMGTPFFIMLWSVIIIYVFHNYTLPWTIPLVAFILIIGTFGGWLGWKS